jgi:hypothetical protein
MNRTRTEQQWIEQMPSDLRGHLLALNEHATRRTPNGQ